MNCVETMALSHQFSNKEQVLHNINLIVPQGAIYGFLGPNGAGKTTTLRLLLGLLKMQEGAISIFGEAFENNRISILKRTGSLIESPSLYGHLNAIENLKLWQQLYQCPKERIQTVLNLVGLSKTGSKKASKFSLGMKQRLGIATSLLHQPELLILDEPTNGLDPNGILEIRELLVELNKQSGITILISSHILSEIEKLVSHIGIIHKGNLLLQGTFKSLMEKQQQSTCIYFETNDNVKAMQLMEISATLQAPGNKIRLPIMPKEKIAQLNTLLTQNGVDVYEIKTEKNDLEQIFMQLIKEN